MLQTFSIRSINIHCCSRFQVAAFSTIRTTRRTIDNNIYRTGSSIHSNHNKKNDSFFRLERLLSSSKLNSVANEDDVLSGIDENLEDVPSASSFVKKYVMIRKNKQSMAFRNGSPLVYSGSVQKTIQLDGQKKEEMHQFEMGSLVGIVVSNENEGDSTGGGGKKNSFRGGKRRGKQTKTKVKYNHELVDEVNQMQHSYTMDGEFVSSKDGTKEVRSEISTGKLIGYGFFNPVSMYRVFIFCHQSAHPKLFQSIKAIIKESSINSSSEIDTTEKVLELVLTSKINDAIRARVQQGLPSASTDSYRLVNGEGDGLAGLAIDILGGRVAVIMASAAWCELYRETIMKIVRTILQNEHPIYSKDQETPLDIVWRNTPMRLKQDGYIIPEESSSESQTDSQSVENDTTPVVITENGIKYNTFPYDVSSQKTGFYCDQRENRFNLANFCAGKRVLDLCCYSGGFALNAMIHGGASSCVGVDSSQVAIAAAEENKELNNVSSSVSFVKMDIVPFMHEAFESGKEFDVIVLDPPKLAPTIAQLDRASRKYHSLNRDAMKLINQKEGGLLLTCSCSGAMTQKNGGQFFLETIQGAALAAKRRITLLSMSGAAPCHAQDPASFPANAYLAVALFSVSPVEE